MGEIKSVKVDNWGVFFLQKLQNFFNKTDYCDLTLQFNDNSQLKVHKLVLSACTDYFNVLEQTCEMIDDILIMPNELQADLVVPIVNFMYTGTLEFELKMYGKLLKTARDMNMTVLLKLLEAHRRTMEGGTKQVVRNTKTSPRQTYLNAGIKPTASIPTIIETSSGNTGQAKRRILSTKIEPYRKLQIKPISSTTYTDSNTILTRYPNTKITPIKGPSRFEYEGENILQDTFESSFDTISYESKPLKEEILDDDDDNQQKQPIKQESTTSLQFEQLRHTGYNNNKRPAQSILQSPPTKKPNIQDVKEYAEQQRMRKQIAEEYGEEFEDTLDDEFHNADDDEEYNISAPIKHQVTNKKLPTTSNLRQKSQHNQINKKTIALTTKQEEKPRIVVKDSTSSNVDHAKIISEVLRKYPHLIKNNKNIKLKIMPNASGNGGPQRVVIKKESDTNMSPVPSTSKIAMTTGIQEAKVLKFSPQQKVTTTTIAAQVQPSTVAASTTTAVAQSSSQPRRIDSKTMKALISLGAENTTGPWLCLRCGVNGRPISIPSYRGFRRHLTNTHKEKIDARLCEHCGWRSTTQKELLFHMQMEHQIKCNINFPKCEHCNLVVLDLAALDDHIDEYHLENKEENQQCIYCNKTFSTEILLYNHMKAQHKERARDDGVIDFSDDEHTGEFVDDNEVVDDSNNYEQESTNQKLSPPKIQILSDINLSKCISLTKSTDLPANTLQQEHTITTSDATILGNIDYITTSTAEDTGPKFVNAEGNVMELTQAQRDEIISQLEQSGDGVVMVLNDESFVNDEKITNIVDSSTGKIQSIASQQFGDNMLIVYDQQQTITTSKTNEKIIKENKEEKNLSKEDEGDDDEEMECKNDVSQDEIEKETTEELENEENINQAINDKKEFEDISKTKKEDKDSSDLDMKLKLLTGDWTEDEDEDEECHHITDDKENKKNKASGDDKILDILEKNNDSSDITSENIKTELKDDNVKPEIQEQHENDENQNISAKTEDIEEIETKKDHKIADDSKNNDDEENFETYTDHSEKDEEILFSTEIGSTFEEKTVEQKPNIDENDDNKSVVTTIIETDTKETTDNSAENMENKEEKEENSEELRKIKESDKTTLHEEFSVGEERNDDVSKKDDELKTVSISHDIIEELEKIEDENLSKSDENDQVIAHVTTTESKDEIDELSQTKTKDEIKNLISEWGEDDDDL